MSFSDFIKGIPNALAQPFSIAVLASVGVHGIAALAVPSFYSSPEVEESQPVGLLNASEINQSGLPNLERPPELALLDPDQLTGQKKPGVIQGRTVPGIPRRSRDSGSTGTKISKNPAQAQKQQQQRQLSIKEIEKLASQQVKKHEQNINKTFNQLRKQDVQELEAEKQRLQEEYKKKELRLAEQNPNDSKDSNSTPNQDSKTDNTAENTTPVASNNDREKDQGFDNGQSIPEAISGSEAPETQEVSSQLRERLARVEPFTADNQANVKALKWAESVQQQIGITPDISKPDLSTGGNYPKEACFGEKVNGEQLQGAATYGVIVNAEGKISGEPFLIGSSGYHILDEQAKADLKAPDLFAKNPQPTPYLVEVTYPYNPQVCDGN